MSSIVNKIKDAVHSDSKHQQSAPEGTYGPHGSRMANAADPRVDSDRDHSATVGGTTGQYHKSDNYTFGGSGYGHDGPASNTAGPHSSNLANKADPRVDSDRDGSRTMGNTGTTGTTGFGSGFGHDGPASQTAGPHSSNLANKADPRVDSDRDGRAGGMGMTSGTTGGFTGTRSHAEGTHGPHNSRLANAADPRVDSDRDGSRTMGGGHGTTGGLMGTTGTYGTHGTHTTTGRMGAAVGGTHGTGPAPNTAGPHKSDMLNKVDPRVDSDLDGSKTYGTNQTYSQS